MNLLFTYDGNTAGFDQTIAEDIELYLYDDQGKKMNERHIPYENIKVNPEKPDVPLNKNDAFQKVQKRRVQEKR